MYAIFSSQQMEFFFLSPVIDCPMDIIWLWPDGTGPFFPTFSDFVDFFCLSFFITLILIYFDDLLGKKYICQKKKFGLFPYISSYKGISKEMVPKHWFWIFSQFFHNFCQFFGFECQYSWLSSSFIENIS